MLKSLMAAVPLLLWSLASEACLPPPLPAYCRGKPDGARVTLKAGDTGMPRFAESWDLTCSAGKVAGPSVLHLGDAGWPGHNYLPGVANVRRIEVDAVESWTIEWDGPVKGYDAEGRLLMEAEQRDDWWIGKFTLRYPDGRQQLSAEYASSDNQRGRLQGRLMAWHANGLVAHSGYFCLGNPVGLHLSYDSGGALSLIEDYSKSAYVSRPDLRRIVEPKDPDASETSCAGRAPLIELMGATAFRERTDGTGVPLPLQVSAAPEWDIWVEPRSDASVADWVRPGARIKVVDYESIPTVILSVPADYRHRSLQQDYESWKKDPSAGIIDKQHLAMLTACGDFLDEAFAPELSPQEQRPSGAAGAD